MQALIDSFYNITYKETLEAVSLFLVIWLITHQHLYNSFMEWCFDYLYEISSNKYYLLIIDKLDILLGCPKCLSFWIILFMTWNPILALGGAFIASLSMSIENKK